MLFIVMMKRANLEVMSGLTLDKLISKIWMGFPWTKY